MNFIYQFLRIMLVCFIGEVLNYLLPLPIPVNIYGLILMLGLLYVKAIKVEQVEPAGKFLRDVMPIMFIPAGAKLITVWNSVQSSLMPIVHITIVSTVLVMVSTGLVCQLFVGNKNVSNQGKVEAAVKIDLKRQLEVIAIIILYGITFIATRNVKFSTEFFENSAFFGVITSLLAYWIGVKCKERYKLPIYNPLLLAILMVIGFLSLFKVDYAVYNSGAQYISYFLTPATVALAIPLYQRLADVRRYFKAIMLGISTGVIVNMICILALSKAFHLSRQLYVTLLPKSITTAIGLSVSEQLGGISTLTVAIIIVTGILGNIFAETICKVFHIRNPIAMGIAIGTSSHAMGTSRALEIGEVQGAMSSLSIVITGLITVIMATVFSWIY